MFASKSYCHFVEQCVPTFWRVYPTWASINWYIRRQHQIQYTHSPTCNAAEPLRERMKVAFIFLPLDGFFRSNVKSSEWMMVVVGIKQWCFTKFMSLTSSSCSWWWWWRWWRLTKFCRLGRKTLCLVSSRNCPHLLAPKTKIDDQPGHDDDQWCHGDDH